MAQTKRIPGWLFLFLRPFAVSPFPFTSDITNTPYGKQVCATVLVTPSLGVGVRGTISSAHAMHPPYYLSVHTVLVP